MKLSSGYQLKTPKKLSELINIHAHLAGALANYNNVDPQPHCLQALVEALKAVTKDTRCEAEALALIETCNPFFKDW